MYRLCAAFGGRTGFHLGGSKRTKVLQNRDGVRHVGRNQGSSSKRLTKNTIFDRMAKRRDSPQARLTKTGKKHAKHHAETCIKNKALYRSGCVRLFCYSLCNFTTTNKDGEVHGAVASSNILHLGVSHNNWAAFTSTFDSDTFKVRNIEVILAFCGFWAKWVLTVQIFRPGSRCTDRNGDVGDIKKADMVVSWFKSGKAWVCLQNCAFYLKK